MLKMPVLLISAANVGLCFAQQNIPFQYFGGRDIDYWNEGKRVKNNVWSLVHEKTSADERNSIQGNFSGSSTIRANDAVPFSWSSYQDPKRAEFWDDGGDWIPPRPFREAAANPTKENIDEYLNWMVKKTQVVDRFQKALSDFTPKDDPIIGDLNWRNIKIVYVYQSSCPHCRNSAGVIEEAKRLGAQVTFVQLDAKKNPPLHENSVSYDEILDLKSHETLDLIPQKIDHEMLDLITQVASTPTWLLKAGNRSTKLIGALSFLELSNEARQLFTKEKSNG